MLGSFGEPEEENQGSFTRALYKKNPQFYFITFLTNRTLRTIWSEGRIQNITQTEMVLVSWKPVLNPATPL